MAFDIYKLDKIEPYSEQAERKLEAYQDGLMELFSKSSEGQERLKIDPEMGFWAAQFVYYGYSYVRVPLPNMTVSDVRQTVEVVFPRKISTSSPEDADDTVPELIAFWQFLKREFRLPAADPILSYLKKIEPGYHRIMNDSSKFGMAKSFFMKGQKAGFDMTDENDMQRFMATDNAHIMAQNPELPDENFDEDESSSSYQRKVKTKKKKARKMAKASRKKNRKRR